MTGKYDSSNLCETDVLIVGGSIAGLSAAIKAKENAPDSEVLVAEKYTAGYAGKANRGAGIVAMLGPYSPDAFVAYQSERIGIRLNDLSALRAYAGAMNDGVAELDKWSGGKLDKWEDGSIKTLKWRSQLRGMEDGVYDFDEENEYPWTLAAIDLDYLIEVRKYAVRIGVKFTDRVGVTEVLTEGGAQGAAVCGAVGFDIDTGEMRVFAAKVVVLACGGQNYRILPMWQCARGDGAAMAWRAGASLANGEFGSFYNWISPHNFESEMGAEYGLYNAKGENVGVAHTAEPHPDIDQNSLAEYYKQEKNGNGPLRYHPDDNILTPFTRSMLGSDAAYFKRPYTNRLWGRLIFNAASQQPDDKIVPGMIGEYGAVQVDADMMTSVPGLFAAGDICYGGSRAFGAVPGPPGRIRGGGLAYALYAGRAAGTAAARYAGTESPGAIGEAQIVAARVRFYAPLNRRGSIGVNDFVFEIQKVMQPIGNSLYRHEARMTKALNRILELRKQLPCIEAKSPHHLFGCVEAEAMLLCAEMFFRASLARKESIGWFLREDYPEPADALRLIVIRNENGEPVVHTEDVE